MAGDGSQEITKYADKDLFWGAGGGSDASSEKADQKEQELTEKENNGEVIKPKSNTRKLSTDEGKAQVWVEEDSVSISNQTTGVFVNGENVVIAGRMSFAKDIKDIRLNGFWTLNEELLTTLPSTLYTPIPVLQYKEPPFASKVGKLAKLLA